VEKPKQHGIPSGSEKYQGLLAKEYVASKIKNNPEIEVGKIN